MDSKSIKRCKNESSRCPKQRKANIYFAGILLFFVLFLPNTALSQNTPYSIETDTFFEQLRRRTWRNDKYILRDFGKYIAKPEAAQAVASTLFSITNFTKQEFDWNGLQKFITNKQPERASQMFLQFFYENVAKFKRDDLLGLWYLTHIEQQEISDFIIRPMPQKPKIAARLAEINTNLKNAISLGDTALFRKNLQNASELRNPEAWNLLLQITKNEELTKNNKFPNQYDWRLKILEALRFCPKNEALLLIENWLENDLLDITESEFALSELLNHFISQVGKKAILAQIKSLKEKYGDLAGIKKGGFQTLYNLEPYFFASDAEYYARTLCFVMGHPWAYKNAREGLMATNDPKSLYFLATSLFRYRHDSDIYNERQERYLRQYLTPIEDLTRVKVYVSDTEGASSDGSLDATWLLNYVQYWATHYADYQWDSKIGHYINRHTARTVLAQNERFFSLLNSHSDSVAFDAFRQVSRFETPVLLEFREQFPEIYNSQNLLLPPAKWGILQPLTALHKFAEEQKLSVEESEILKNILQNLLKNQSPKSRYSIENEAIAQLNYSDATALELAAVLYSYDQAFAFSAARILQNLYERDWQKMVGEEPHFRFFLKKATLFEQINASGNCRQYLEKPFLKNAICQSALHKLKARETDLHIQESIEKILAAQTPSLKNAPVSEEEKAAQFENQKTELSQAKTVEISAVNKFINSPFFAKPAHKSLILNVLQKLKTPSQIRNLQANGLFSAAEDLPVFEKLNIAPEQWPMLVAAFDAESGAILSEFLLNISEKLPAEKQGYFLNSCMNTKWFGQYLGVQNRENSIVQNYKKGISEWFEGQENISEFEEEKILYNLILLENAGGSFYQKIGATFNLETSERAKAKIQKELLAAASLKDLALIAPTFADLSTDENGQAGIVFLSRDFGLPPLPYSENPDNQVFVKSILNLSEPEIYKFYLREFGVNFEKPESETLDLQAIFDILGKDFVMPFIGTGGDWRDWYIFALTKVLEAEFKTSLGFHPKLNENQTFYIYNVGKRAQAWREFLINKNVVKQ